MRIVWPKIDLKCWVVTQCSWFAVSCCGQPVSWSDPVPVLQRAEEGPAGQGRGRGASAVHGQDDHEIHDPEPPIPAHWQENEPFPEPHHLLTTGPRAAAGVATAPLPARGPRDWRKPSIPGFLWSVAPVLQQLLLGFYLYSVADCVLTIWADGLGYSPGSYSTKPFGYTFRCYIVPGLTTIVVCCFVVLQHCKKKQYP